MKVAKILVLCRDYGMQIAECLEWVSVYMTVLESGIFTCMKVTK